MTRLHTVLSAPQQPEGTVNGSQPPPITRTTSSGGLTCSLCQRSVTCYMLGQVTAVACPCCGAYWLADDVIAGRQGHWDSGEEPLTLADQEHPQLGEWIPGRSRDEPTAGFNTCTPVQEAIPRPADSS